MGDGPLQFPGLEANTWSINGDDLIDLDFNISDIATAATRIVEDVMPLLRDASSEADQVDNAIAELRTQLSEILDHVHGSAFLRDLFELSR